MTEFRCDGYKFYHGTSTIFLDSIKKTGLGTINPNIDLKLLDVLRVLYTQVKSAGVKDQQLSIWEDAIRATVAQTDLIYNNGLKLNFRHDGIYISASHMRAAIYALNKYGSEVLEKCIMLLETLERHHVAVEIPPEIDLFDVRNYLHAEPKPIIIEVLQIDDDDLDKEDGKTAAEALIFLRNIIPTLSEKEKFEFLQFCNFKILKAVPPEKLRFYAMDFEGHPKTGDFKIYLSKI